MGSYTARQDKGVGLCVGGDEPCNSLDVGEVEDLGLGLSPTSPLDTGDNSVVLIPLNKAG